MKKMFEITEDMEVKILASGSNWLRIGSMLTLGLIGYDSRLPKGATASVHSMDTGVACLRGLDLVDSGTYHFGMTSPPWLARSVAEGRLNVGFEPRKLNLSAVCVFPHHDQMAFALRRDLGIRSIEEIKAKKAPLRISTGPLHDMHPLGIALDLVLAEYGIEIEDFEKWGGRAGSSDRQLNVLPEGRSDRADRVSLMRRGDLDGVFDEGIMSKTWKDIADDVELEFLPVDEEVLDRLEEKYGVGRSVLPKDRLRGVDKDVPAVDFAGWLLYCHTDLPDELVYNTLIALEEQKTQLESLFEPQRPYQGMSELPFNMAEIWKNTGLPLHSGAEAFFRDRGYMA